MTCPEKIPRTAVTGIIIRRAHSSGRMSRILVREIVKPSMVQSLAEEPGSTCRAKSGRSLFRPFSKPVIQVPLF